MKRYVYVGMVAVLLAGPFAMIGCSTDDQLIMVKRDLSTRIDMVDSRVSRLEGEGSTKKEIEDLRKKQVDMYNNLESLRSNVQDMTGTLEGRVLKMQREMQGRPGGAAGDDTASMRAEISRMNERISLLESRLGMAGGEQETQRQTAAVQQPKSEPRQESRSESRSESRPEHRREAKPEPKQPSAPPTPHTEDGLYNAARDLYTSGQYDASQQMLEQFLSKYPQSRNADSAQFWIGECYFKKKDYGKAILEYQKVVEKYAKGNKVPDALLKQGMSFKALGDKTSAKILFKKVTEQYARSPQADVAQRELEKL